MHSLAFYFCVYGSKIFDIMPHYIRMDWKPRPCVHIADIRYSRLGPLCVLLHCLRVRLSSQARVFVCVSGLDCDAHLWKWAGVSCSSCIVCAAIVLRIDYRKQVNAYIWDDTWKINCYCCRRPRYVFVLFIFSWQCVCVLCCCIVALPIADLVTKYSVTFHIICFKLRHIIIYYW